MVTSNSNVTVNVNVDVDKSAEELIYTNLVAWIEQSGGHVHRDLQLRGVDVDPQQGRRQQQSEAEHRGVFCSATTGIQKGECLIRLPSACSTHGKDSPFQYDYTPSTPSAATADSTRTVSPWLRCLAGYYQAQGEAQFRVADSTNFNCYKASLPDHYETLWEWTSDEMESYLAGTSVAATGSGSGDDDNNNSKEKELAVLLQRYREHIRPYLQHCDCGGNDGTETISDSELQRFQTACQCLSTRGFNLSLSERDHDTDATSYNGPFLLPWIDLLNHCSRSSSTDGNLSDTPTKCTTLARLPDDSFVMMADRDIVPGEEILHSYGDHLTASQFLQTFGFVPETAVEHALSSSSSPLPLPNSSDCIPVVTPAVLSKMAVLEACWSVMESNMPEQLAASMREQEMEDDTWTVSVDRSRTASFISDDLVIDVSQDDILTDELVTLACLPFLPVCAYREAGRNFLDVSILGDYYLGKLVCTSLLKAIQSKLDTYTPIRRIMNDNVNEISGQPTDDREFLRQVVQQEQASPDVSTRRLMYALVVRLEEKSCLEALRRKVIGILARLDEEAEEFPASSERGGGEEDANGKRPRTSNE